MAEHHNLSKDEAPTKRLTKGAIRLRQLLIRKAKGQKTPMDIDVDIGTTIGPNANVFISYLGMLARERISLVTPFFDHGTKVDRNMIWQDLLVININVIYIIV